MKLTREQREGLTRALAAAFPGYEELDHLTQFKLDRKLNLITAPASHLTLALRVVNWVEAHDALFPDLIAGALNQNPENTDLQEVARELGLDEGAGAFEARVLDEIHVIDVEDWRARMMRSERPVCRIELARNARGTGFLVGSRQLITNCHVIQPVLDGTHPPADLTVRFDYKVGKDLKAMQEGVEYKLAAGRSWLEASSPVSELDYAVLRLTRKAADEPAGGQPGAPARGYLTPEAWEFKASQPLFIIQHPDGSALKFAAGTITDTSVPAHRVAHNVTTQPGSSGSPAFSSDWRVIGLHHWGLTHDHNRLVPFSAILRRLKEQGVAIGQ